MALNTRLNTVTIKGGGALQIDNGGNLPISEGENWDQGWMKVGDSGTAGSLTVAAGAGLSGFSAKEIEIGYGGDATFTLNSGTVTNRSRQLGIGSGAGRTSTCYLNGGALNAPTPYGIVAGSGSGASVTVYQNGTDVTLGNDGLYSTFASGPNSTVTWYLQDGTWSGGGLSLGTHATGVAQFIQTGGTSYQSVEMVVGTAGTALYSISGGTLDTKQGIGYSWGSTVTVGNSTGQGTFRVIGDDSTVKVASYWGGGTQTLFTLGANGTLEYVIDGATVTPIQIEGRGGAAGQNKQASLAGVIDLDLNAYAPTYLDTYDLLTAGTVIDNGYTLAAEDLGIWELSIVGTAGSGQTLRAQYMLTIPEPTSLSLLALAGLALRRRRQ